MASAPEATTVVIGAGSWGTALASLLARNGRPTMLWGRNSQQMREMAASNINKRYLPDIDLAKTLLYTPDIKEALTFASDVLLAIPSHVFRQTLDIIAPHLRLNTRLLWATKGFESATGKLLHQVVDESLGKNYPTAVISGPTFAAEVAKGMPTAITLASKNAAFANELAQRFHSDTFRVYTADDIAGVEIGGALKNVFAIAAGISDGLGFGANSRAALITRALAEMMRLGESLGGHRETFMGLTGLGDLILTCTDNQSRNRRFGLALGQGQSIETAQKQIDQVVEGVYAVQEAVRLAAKFNIDMPITEQVHQVILGQRTPRQAVNLLLHRQQKSENF